MSGVTSIKSATSTTAAVGPVTVTTTQPGLLGITTNGTSLNFAPTQTAVNSFNGKSGAVTLANTDGTLGIAFVPAFSANAVLTGSTANTALASVQNLSGAGAWVTGTQYYKGATVFSVASPTNLYIAVADIPSSTTDPSTDTANWLQIASTGGGSGGNSISGGGSSVTCDTTTGDVAILSKNVAGVGISIKTNTTQIIMDNYNAGTGVANVITLQSGTDGSTYTTNLIIDAADNTPPSQGLYVSPTTLKFNGAPVGGDVTSITNGGSTFAIDAGGAATFTQTTPADENSIFQVDTRGSLSAIGLYGGSDINVQADKDLVLNSGSVATTGVQVNGYTSLINVDAYGNGFGGSLANQIQLLGGVGDATAASVWIGGASSATTDAGLFVGTNDITWKGTSLVNGGGSGNMLYTAADFAWAAGKSYTVGEIVNHVVANNTGSVVYVCSVANTAVVGPPSSNGNEPGYDPTTWQSVGSASAVSFSGDWANSVGYQIGNIVNLTEAPIGLYICLQNISTPTPPATNPNPSTTPTFWAQLNAGGVPAGSSMTYSGAAWDSGTSYPAQTLLNDWATLGSWVNPAAVASGGTAPQSNSAWQPVTYGYSYYYGPWATGIPYPQGALTTDSTEANAIYSANNYIDGTPTNSPRTDATNWTFLTNQYGAVWRDAWVTTSIYQINHIVSYAGLLYISITNNNTGSTPTPTGTTPWVALANQYGALYASTFSPTNTYYLNNLIAFNDATYISLANDNTSAPLPTADANWAQIGPRRFTAYVAGPTVKTGIPVTTPYNPVSIFKFQVPNVYTGFSYKATVSWSYAYAVGNDTSAFQNFGLLIADDSTLTQTASVVLNQQGTYTFEAGGGSGAQIPSGATEVQGGGLSLTTFPANPCQSISIVFNNPGVIAPTGRDFYLVFQPYAPQGGQAPTGNCSFHIYDVTFDWQCVNTTGVTVTVT